MVKLKLKLKNAEVRHIPSEKEVTRFLENRSTKKMIEEKEKKAFEEGYAKRSSEVINILQSLEAIKAQINGLKTQIISEYEPMLVDLSLKVAEKVLERELISGTAKIESIIKNILVDIPASTKIIIKLNPNDLYQMNEIKYDLTPKGDAYVEIQPDETVSVGGCMIDTDIGMIDASIETRIKKIFDCMKGND